VFDVVQSVDSTGISKLRTVRYEKVASLSGNRRRYDERSRGGFVDSREILRVHRECHVASFGQIEGPRASDFCFRVADEIGFDYFCKLTEPWHREFRRVAA